MGLRNHLPSEVITDPISVEEAYRGSLKAMLLRYVGNYVVATFLVGTQNTVAWEGILYDVGNDYVTIYQEGRDRYIVSDVYSLKFIEFYDTRCREMCHEMLQNGQCREAPPEKTVAQAGEIVLKSTVSDILVRKGDPDGF